METDQELSPFAVMVFDILTVLVQRFIDVALWVESLMRRWA